MLPRASRMHRSTDFSAVVRRGVRSRQAALIVHHHRDLAPSAGAPVVGLIVSRAVGGSVVRHHVSRRLRAQLTARLGSLPPGSGTVVRALPGSASSSSLRLGRDLDRAFAMLALPAGTAEPARSSRHSRPLPPPVPTG